MTLNITNIAEADAYFMEGAIWPLCDLRNHSFDKFSGGCGFVTELCQYAAYSDALATAGYAATGDYPGAYGYEVQAKFGEWFTLHYIEHGDVPTTDQCRVWLLNATEEFFLSGGAPVDHLSKALMEVECP